MTKYSAHRTKKGVIAIRNKETGHFEGSISDQGQSKNQAVREYLGRTEPDIEVDDPYGTEYTVRKITNEETGEERFVKTSEGMSPHLDRQTESFETQKEKIIDTEGWNRKNVTVKTVERGVPYEEFATRWARNEYQ